MLTLYVGENKKESIKYTYNICISQLGIRTEMAFGLLTTKWRILKSPLHVKVDNIGTEIMAITRLHTYCMNERVYDDSDFNNAYSRETVSITPNQYNTPTTNSSGHNQNSQSTGCTNTHINQKVKNATVTLEERPYLPMDITNATIVGHSMLRQIYIEKLLNTVFLNQNIIKNKH
jgi:hypothetical protein